MNDPNWSMKPMLITLQICLGWQMLQFCDTFPVLYITINVVIYILVAQGQSQREPHNLPEGIYLLTESGFNDPQLTDATSEYHFANLSGLNNATILWHVSPSRIYFSNDPQNLPQGKYLLVESLFNDPYLTDVIFVCLFVVGLRPRNFYGHIRTGTDSWQYALVAIL